MMKVAVCSGNLPFCSSKLLRREYKGREYKGREYKAADLCLSFSFITLFSLPNILCQSWYCIGWYLANCVWDIAEWLESLTAKADVRKALGSIIASFDTVESEGRQMKYMGKKSKKSHC
jgi:hypothetical protein